MVQPMKHKGELMEDARAAFLVQAGWKDAALSPLAGDASTRSYMRAQAGDRQAVLMIAPPAAETAPCPPQASDMERKALGYNATARLAGPNLNAFLAIAGALREAGLSAPEIYAADADAGLALIEDLGDDLYARIVGDVDETKLYSNAVDALLVLQQQNPSPPAIGDYEMLTYDQLALATETELFLEWYWPLKKGEPAPYDLLTEYLEIFQDLITSLSPPQTIVLRDYHAENLLWLPKREGAARTGLIDVQDGLYGNAAYDVVSLLEDARRDVDPALADAMIKRYCESAENIDAETFQRDYAILAAQRNAKILGIFARLAKRDNKPRYLDLLPRVEALFRKDIARSGLEPLQSFAIKHFPELG